MNTPKDIFEKFEKRTRVNSIYSESANKIKGKIFEKLRQELELARKFEPADCKNKHILKFES